MKRIAVAMLLMTSCNPERRSETIDGCEYINSQSWNGHGYTESLTHKGNCKNPIHLHADTIKNVPVVYEPIKFTK